MELVSFAKDVIQNVVEQAASYRIGQAALRHFDRALWVVEKCARWAVPPPLDVDDTPQPELVRPLPWVFFLMMLVTLRVARESISVINLLRGQPPLRSADVVIYIQSKRRYLRTLKYQGNRNMRARSSPQGEPWYRGLQALFEFTMCFRRSTNYGNNNTTRVSNNDEVLVVKRGKRTRDASSPGASTSDTTMERLIEKMMVQLDADSDDDSSFTLTNATSLRSDQSGDSDPEQDTTNENLESTVDSDVVTAETNASPTSTKPDDTRPSPDVQSQTNNAESPEKIKKEIEKKEIIKTENGADKENIPAGKMELSEPNTPELNTPEKDTKIAEPPVNERKQLKYSPTIDDFLQNERCSPQKQPSKYTKFGRKIAKAFSKTFSIKKHERSDIMGLMNQRRDSDTPIVRISHSDDSL